MPKPSSQYVVEDREQGLTLEISDTECYYGFSKDSATLITDAKWKVYRRVRITVGTAFVYVGSYADGDENYDNIFNPSDAAGILAIQALTFPAWGLTIP
jgi:hypothetical protein